MQLPFKVRLFAKLGGMLQDGGAHKSVWHSRGDSASKFCLLCKNLFTEESQLAEADGTKLLSCNCLKWSDLVQASSRDLRAAARYLETKESTMPPDAFRNLQQGLGITHHKHSLLLDRYLDEFVDPVGIYLHDWMHAFFVDGIFNVVLYLVLEAAMQKGFTSVYTVFSDYVAKWTWPLRVNGSHLHEIFDDSRRDKHRAAKHIKCQASDGLSLVGVAAHFVSTVLLNLVKMKGADVGCEKECYAFLALVDVIELIVASARITVQPERLLTAAETFLHLFRDSWGYEWMTPKFHWMLHFWRQLLNSKKMLSCFCLERKHRVPKRYATEIKNISKGSSKSLLMEVVSHHLGQLRKPDAFSFEVGLVGGSIASKRIKQLLSDELELDPKGEAAQAIKCSPQVRFSPFALCDRNDVIIFKDGNGFRAGRVQLHCEVHGWPISMVSVFAVHKVGADSGYSEWTALEDQFFIGSEDILDSVVYSTTPDGKVAILLPPEFR